MKIRTLHLFLPLLLILSLLVLIPWWKYRGTAFSPTPAFFHWQTKLALTPAEQAYLNELKARRLYVKFFDIDWEKGRGAIPLASLQADTHRLGNLEIVPAVFLTNRCMERLPESEIDTLAARIAAKVFRLADQAGWRQVPEVQLDCDWTGSTQSRYFRLLNRLRPLLAARGASLSATIRLHQLRYPERTGIPPVDRGLLMCYNVGEIGSWEEENSILRPEAVAPYLKNCETYPLPLDLALPVFSWGAVYRDGRLVRLIHGLRPDQISAPLRFAKIGAQRFEVLKSTYLDGYFLYQGDRIRIETIDASTLQETARLISPCFRRGSYFTAFFHLDTATVNALPEEILEDVVHLLGPN